MVMSTLLAKIDEVHIEFYQTPKGGTPIKFLVSVPADHFDMLPDDPGEEEEPESPFNEVILNASLFKGQILRLGTALWVFSNYQKYFIDTENGRVYFKDEPGRDFLAIRYRERIYDFRDDLIGLLHVPAKRIPQ